MTQWLYGHEEKDRERGILSPADREFLLTGGGGEYPALAVLLLVPIEPLCHCISRKAGGLFVTCNQLRQIYRCIRYNFMVWV